MLLAWKNAQRLEASTFLLMASVCAPLPSVSDSARNKAITAISNAIFLFELEACSACSACSMLSCALMLSLSSEIQVHDCRTACSKQASSRCLHCCFEGFFCQCFSAFNLIIADLLAACSWLLVIVV